MARRLHRNERGVALVLAVLVLTAIGALVAAAFFAATQEQRMGEYGRRAQRALGAADAGIIEVLRQWLDDAASLRLYPDDSLVLSPVETPQGTGTFAAIVYRTGPDLFLIDVIGRDRALQSRVRLGMLVSAPMPCDTAIVEGLELSHSKCHIDNGFQKSSGLHGLRSRAWIQLVQGS